MSKYREYTGLVRTPSSMAWLIDNRARMLGKLERLEASSFETAKRLDEMREEVRALEQLVASRETMKADLKSRIQAIGEVIRLHEVAVNPEEIRAIQPRTPALTGYGCITRAVYECLRENGRDRPLYTSEIALYVAERCDMVFANLQEQTVFTRHVRRRMKAMAAAGDLVRHHAVDVIGSQEEGRWSIAP